MKDSKKFFMHNLSLVLIVASVVFLVQLIYSNSMVNAANQLDRYWTALTGDQQIPPVTTDARGYVGLKFQDDLTRVAYIVNAENIGNVTGIYIYQSDKNQTGTVVLDLLKGTKKVKKHVEQVLNTTPEGKITGTLSIGGAMRDDLQGELKGKPLSDLYNLMVKGSIYVSINTIDFPHGEVRGDSFVGIDDLFPALSDIKWGLIFLNRLTIYK
ncbi:MAG: CHRD domain-containing protein [Thermoproteota archaeon]|nr:CHRD domain-containing protein [Thermoproteota archaeon]